jgi:hypothetical protein
VARGSAHSARDKNAEPARSSLRCHKVRVLVLWISCSESGCQYEEYRCSAAALATNIDSDAPRTAIRDWIEIVGRLARPQMERASWFPGITLKRESALLKVTLDGKASVLLRSSNPEVWGEMASPDGRLLAITEAGGPKNLWQVEHF